MSAEQGENLSRRDPISTALKWIVGILISIAALEAAFVNAIDGWGPFSNALSKVTPSLTAATQSKLMSIEGQWIYSKVFIGKEYKGISDWVNTECRPRD